MNDRYGVLILSFNSSMSPLTLIYILDRYSEIHKASQSFLSPPPSLSSAGRNKCAKKRCLWGMSNFPLPGG